MALTKTTQFRGIQINDAYVRIDTFAGSASSMRMSVNWYASQAAFTGGQGFFYQEMIDFVPDAEDGAASIWSQGYAYLKSLPEFAGAADA